MTLVEFKALAKEFGTVETFQTCNNYGYGGSYSIYHIIGEYTYRESSYRTLIGYVYKEYYLTVKHTRFEGLEITEALKTLTIPERTNRTNTKSFIMKQRILYWFLKKLIKGLYKENDRGHYFVNMFNNVNVDISFDTNGE